MFISGDYEGKTVAFKMGTREATPTATWVGGTGFAVNLEIASPAATQAPSQACVFSGTVTEAGSAVPDGTRITAWIYNYIVGETQTQGSYYSMSISGAYEGKTVTFKMGDREATPTATWVRGTDVVVNLEIAPAPSGECTFYGSVTLNGTTVLDGTQVSAWIDGTKIVTVATINSGYHLTVPGYYPGKAVSFRVGSDLASQSASWALGAAVETNLTVGSAIDTSLGPPVCGFYGSVVLDNRPVPNGTPVEAFIGSVSVLKVNTVDSWFTMNITGNYSGQMVVFKINGERAAQTATWVRGGNLRVYLSAVSAPTPMVTSTFSTAETYAARTVTLEVKVNPKRYGVSGAEIDINGLDNTVMELVPEGTTLGSLLGSSPVEGNKEMVQADNAQTFRYAIARQGTTPVPTTANVLITFTLRIKPNVPPGVYRVPLAVTLTDQGFKPIPLTVQNAAITVIRTRTADLNRDGIVGLEDLAILASVYGTVKGQTTSQSASSGNCYTLYGKQFCLNTYGLTSPSTAQLTYRPDADLNDDYKIDIADLAILASNWGKVG